MSSTYPIFVAFTMLNGARVMYNNAVPTAASDGAFQTGDIIYNMSPTPVGPANPLGWVCVAGGSPGTWDVFGAVSAGVKLLSTAAPAISTTVQATYVITYDGGAQGATLAAPTAANNGLIIEVTSATAHAHTITATTLLNNGGAGVPYTTATFAAFAGASIKLMAYNQLWQVLSVNNVTLT